MGRAFVSDWAVVLLQREGACRSCWWCAVGGVLFPIGRFRLRRSTTHLHVVLQTKQSTWTEPKKSGGKWEGRISAVEKSLADEKAVRHELEESLLRELKLRLGSVENRVDGFENVASDGKTSVQDQIGALQVCSPTLLRFSHLRLSASGGLQAGRLEKSRAVAVDAPAHCCPSHGCNRRSSSCSPNRSATGCRTWRLPRTLTKRAATTPPSAS